MTAELLSDAVRLFGLLLVALYVAAFWPLRRVMTSPNRPAWLRKPLHVEYVMLAHIALLLAGAALFLRG